MGMFGKVRRTAICLRHDLDKVDGLPGLRRGAAKSKALEQIRVWHIYIYTYIHIYIYIYIYITN